MKSLYARFVLFLIRPALERWAAEKEAAQSMKLREFMDFQEQTVEQIADLSVTQAEAAQAKADEASRVLSAIGDRVLVASWQSQPKT